MGWTTVTDTTDIQDPDLCNEYITALNERRAALSEAGLAAVIDGHDIQSGDQAFSGMGTIDGEGFFSAIQKWISDNCTSFARAYDAAGAKYANTDLEGASVWPNYTNLADLMARVTGDAGRTSFRRYTTHPLEGGSPAADGIAIPAGVGDIVGPWLHEDIQLALNGLIWVKHDCQVAVPASGNYNKQGVSGLTAGWAAAKAAAEADWANSPILDQNASSNFLPVPPVFDEGIPFATWAYNTGGGFDARITAHRVRGMATGVPNFSLGAVRRERGAWWFGTVIAPTSSADNDVFDLQDEGPWTEDEYNLVAEQATTADSTTIYSDVLTELNMPPNWCDEPSTGTGECLGFEGGADYAVIVWDVPDGFEYV